MVGNFANLFGEADRHYKEGRYTDSIREINEILKDENISLEENLTALYLKTFALIKQKKHSEAEETSESIIEEGNRTKNLLFQIDGYLAKAAVKNDLRQLGESTKLIEKSEKILKNSKTLTEKQSKQRSANLLRIKGWNLLYGSKLNEALDCFEERIELCRKEGDTFELGVGLNDAGLVLMYLGELETSLKFYKQGLELFKDSGYLRYLANLYNNIAIIHYQRGELNQALEYSGKSLALREELGEEYDIARISHQLGTIYSQLGDLDKALEHYLKCNEIYEKKGVYIDQSRSLIDIHYVYKRKGEYDLALTYLNEHLELSRENNDDEGISITLNYLGRVHVERGELDKAEIQYKNALKLIQDHEISDALSDVYYSLGELYYLQNKLEGSLKYHLLSMEIREKIGYPFQKAHSLKNLVRLHLDLELIEKASEYQLKLKKLADETENTIVKQISKLCEALILKNSIKSKDISKAEFLLEQLISEEIVDYQITIEALLIVTNILLEELYEKGDENILEEISEKMDQLENIASIQESFSLHAEISLLRSQLLMLKLDTEGALRVLNEAQILAEQKRMNRIGLRLSNAYDDVFDKISMWEDFTMRLPTIAEKMELLHIEEHLENLIKRRQAGLQDINKEEEVPQMIIIKSVDGSVILTEQFDDFLGVDIIESVFQEISKQKLTEFDETGIYRSRIDDYSYLLLNDENIIVCYIFMGKSYAALSKIKQFAKQLFKYKKSKKIIEDYILEPKELDYLQRKILTEIIDKVFLKK